MATLIDHEGKLAINFGWFTDYDKPQESRTLIVGKADAERYQNLLGLYLEFQGDTGWVWYNGKRYVFETDDKEQWTKITETRPIKKPRDGKYHTWAWRWGRWYKENK